MGEISNLPSNTQVHIHRIEWGFDPEFLERGRNLGQWVLRAGSGIMGFSLTVHMIEASQSDFFKNHTRIATAVQILGAGTAVCLSLISGPLVFVILCVGNIAMAVFFDKKAVLMRAIPFLIDMEEEAKQKLDRSYIGYEAHLETIAETLLLPEKNNALLMGELGIGKTAIVETIAMKKVKNELPPGSPFLKKKLIRIDMRALMADTMYRGQVAGRIKQLTDLIQHEKGQVVFFIDEIHSILYAGNTMNYEVENIPSMLKEPLSRKGICLIGATTPAEYNRAFAIDPAFWRRFTPVYVHPPLPEICFKMLQLQRDFLCRHYKTLNINPNITDEAIQAAIFFTEEHVKTNNLPDKALDWLNRGILLAWRQQRGAPAFKGEVHVGLEEIAALHSAYLAERHQTPIQFSPQNLKKYFHSRQGRYFPA